MFVCWSVKGGSGVSVVSALLSLALAKSEGTTIVDLAGDQHTILGLDQDHSLGVRQWLQAGDAVQREAIDRLSLPVSEQLTLVPSGPPVGSAGRAAPAAQAARLMGAFDEHTVVDAGTTAHSSDVTSQLACQASESLLVIRPCYLAIRRAVALPFRPTGLIVVEEPDRVLGSEDMAEVLGVPLVASVPWDSATAKAVDAGQLANRRFKIPKSIQRLATNLTDRELSDVS